ncbi:MAG: acetoacetate--CoA ligase [Myxococcota bacterium]
MTAPLWQPSRERVEQAHLTAFRRAAESEWQVRLPDYSSLHRWSVEAPEQFWKSLWSYAGVVADWDGGVVVQDGQRMPGARWFPGARLNFAENLLRRRDDTPALVFWGEERVRRSLSHAELRDQVARLSRTLRGWGVGPGDRVAGYLPNAPEAVIAMLAATSLGAVWSSCSPDFGVGGALDRFGQIEPRVLFAADGYFYNGRTHDSLERIAELRERLPSLERIAIVQYTRERPALADIPGALTFADALAASEPGEIEFARLPFDHPLYILYSSGTTGAPKCIVHGAGGTLVQHLKEHLLHVDVKPGDRLFYFTTCGWMMWNWLVSGLASGATLLLYDGSPFHPDPKVLFDFAEAERVNIFGTSAKFIDAVAKAGLDPMRSHDLSSLKTLLSTGSPLAPEGFDFVYTKIKRDLCLSSISGGTDIISCFVAGNPTGPVWRGEIQARGLGMKVDVFDENGQPLRGQKGELVCTAPFPSMPVAFWDDADGSKYRAAYFERFPGVWCHGDFAELTEHDGMIIHGRSDAVLNAGGVRIGTAEIYREVEQIDEVLESLAIGQEWQDDTRIVLFVRLRAGLALDDALIERIKARIRRRASPRHVPARVVQVADIPRTRSGKIVELAVREVVHGRAVTNREALANPEALDGFSGLPELQH